MKHAKFAERRNVLDSGRRSPALRLKSRVAQQVKNKMRTDRERKRFFEALRNINCCSCECGNVMNVDDVIWYDNDIFECTACSSTYSMNTKMNEFENKYTTQMFAFFGRLQTLTEGACPMRCGNQRFIQNFEWIKPDRIKCNCCGFEASTDEKFYDWRLIHFSF